MGRFLFYSLPLNVSSRGQFYFETVNKYGDGMRVLVTGGFGFIGGYICRELVNNGWKVRVLDIQNKADRPEFNLNGLEYVIGDIRDYDAVANALEEVDLIIHLAAKHRFFGISEEEFYSVNVSGTDVILKAASQKVIKSLIFYSSVAVYGDQNLPTTEETVPLPNSPYGVTKLEAEKLIRAWVSEHDERRAIIIRPTVVFGPRNRGNVFRLIRQIEKGLFLPVGSGDNIKSVAYVENLVDATMFTYERIAKGVTVYNYADEPHKPFRQIVGEIYRLIKKPCPKNPLPLKPVLIALKPVDLAFRLFNKDFVVTTAIKKMNKATHHQAIKVRQTGFKPDFTIEDGLSKMVDWYIRNKKSRNSQDEVHE